MVRRERMRAWTLAALIAGIVLAGIAREGQFATAEETPAKPRDKPPVQAAAEAPSLSVEQLAEKARKSVVVVTVTGRDGRQQGLGSGFIIAPDGLIATNLHVIGEARPIAVQT